jgi:hypothetical protein
MPFSTERKSSSNSSFYHPYRIFDCTYLTVKTVRTVRTVRMVRMVRMALVQILPALLPRF